MPAADLRNDPRGRPGALGAPGHGRNVSETPRKRALRHPRPAASRPRAPPQHDAVRTSLRGHCRRAVGGAGHSAVIHCAEPPVRNHTVSALMAESTATEASAEASTEAPASHAGGEGRRDIYPPFVQCPSSFGTGMGGGVTLR